ncbi:MAG TPA: PadR family transcriptional regulator [Cyclobacteriaceae bacterium]|nr:PadR family transcriptional regulator [Cyclobacteriaceae bacterium]
MKGNSLGKFEEFVLMTVAVLKTEAFSVSVKRELERRLGSKPSLGSIQSVLKRMDDKGFLTSALGEVTNKRGGRRKRIYYITPAAFKILKYLRELRAEFWNDIEDLNRRPHNRK